MPRQSRRTPRRAKRYKGASSRRGGKKNLKTGKTNAYAPRAKRAFKRMSNPLAENKQVTGSELSLLIGKTATGPSANRFILTDYSLPPIDQYDALTGAWGHAMSSMHTHFNPDSCQFMTHGFDENQMIGRSTYQTMCAAKFTIKWPQPTMNTGITNAAGSGKLFGAIPDQPMNYKLYWGWVPKKLLFTGETSPKANEASAVQIETAINQRVSDYFNDRLDRNAFIPKTTATINIIGSKKLYPPWVSHSGRIPVATVQQTHVDGEATTNVVHQGEIPDTHFKIKWPINRKIHFEPTTKFGNGNVAPTNGATVFYRNYDHLPFAVIVSWNHELLPANDPSNANPDLRYERTRRCPQMLVNDITYYRDS